MKPIINNICQ